MISIDRCDLQETLNAMTFLSSAGGGVVGNNCPAVIPFGRRFINI